MSADILYTFVDPHFYETPSRHAEGTEFREFLREMLPSGWRFKRDGVWLHVAKPDVRVPTQGFKIHASSTTAHALATLGIIAPKCIEHNTTFKLTADLRLLQLLNSKSYDRGGSGKFMTIYPPDTDSFAKLLEELHLATNGLDLAGPYILSDRRYKDSRILYYRYGGIAPVHELQVDGTKLPMLVRPDESLIPDYRHPFFRLPEWVEDPFGGSQELQGNPQPVIGGRFRIIEMLTVSNRGGVYVALDEESGEEVILKEARPYVNERIMAGVTIDSTAQLMREYMTLQQLQESGVTPRPIGIVYEWEHTFLAQQRVPGMPLRQYIVQDENLVLPYVLRPGELDSFLPKFRQIALMLLKAIQCIHDRGVLIGDLSMSNVVVAPELDRLWVIDVESAVSAHDDAVYRRFGKEWYTPGYGRPGRRQQENLTTSDDYYAAGMTCLSRLLK